MQRTITLTDSEVALLSTALWTAGEEYTRFGNLPTTIVSGNMVADTRLKEQFERQHRDCLALRTRLDQADAIQLIYEGKPEIEESEQEQARRTR